MKKFLAKAAVAFLVVAGSVTLGTTAANATEDNVCVPSDAWVEVTPDIEHPAETKVVNHPAETHNVEHPAVVESVLVTPAVPEVLEVSHQEYQWKWWGYANHGQTTWTNGSYPTVVPNHAGGEWRKNGNERKIIDQAYVPGKPAVYQDQVTKEAWTEVVVDKEAWDETVVVKEAYTEVVPDINHPAVECPPIDVPATPANPTAVLTASCGEAFLVLTNPLVKDAEQLTASFVVNIDGDFDNAYSVEAGNRAEVPYLFEEDSGTHKIEVFQAGTSEWKLIASVDVNSDCVVPPTEEPEPETPVTEEPPVISTPVTPVVNEEPKPVKAAARVAASDDTLAQTGGDVNPVLPIGGALLVLGGLALALRRHFSHN